MGLWDEWSNCVHNPTGSTPTKYCRYTWQGKAPSCAHGGYCDGNWKWVKDAKNCNGVDCYGADFGKRCMSGHKALCEQSCTVVAGDETCYLPCTTPTPCADEITSVMVSPILPYPSQPDSVTPTSALINATTTAINYGSSPQMVTVTFTFQYQV